MATRIILDVPALDRLIGGDSEVELELRKSVVENFARQKLATLYSHPEMQIVLADLAETAKREVSARIGEKVRDPKYPNPITWKLTPEVAQALDMAIEDAVRANVAKHLEDIETRVNAAVAKKVEQIQRRALDTVDRAVTGRWQQDVENEVRRIIAAAAGTLDQVEVS